MPATTESDERPLRIDVVAVPWNSTSRMLRDGYRERFVRGAVDPDAMVGLPVIDGHTGQAVGVVEQARDADVGIVATMRLSATSLARDLYTLARDGALGASLGFDGEGRDATLDRAGIVTRSRVTPRELSLTPLPAYEDSRVLNTREAPVMPDYTFTDPSAVTVSSDAEPSTPDAAPAETSSAAPAETRSAPARRPAPVVEYATTADVEALAARLDATRSAAPSSSGHPLGRFGSFGEYAAAVFRGEASPAEVRALTDQVPADNPGVMPPSWLSDVRGIVARSRAMIEGVGGAMSPGATGLSAEWPYFDGDLATLVGVQAAPKTQVTSVAVGIEKGSANLTTYAGGSDLAYQLIERSSPSYLDAYLRIMAAAYGVVTENAFAGRLGVVGTAVPGVTLADLYAAVIEASADVADATGNAPSIIGIAPDLWASIAGAVDSDGRPLYPFSGPVNAPGSPIGVGATAGITIAGIRAVRSLGSPAGTITVTNGDAARWMEDGPRTVAAENVALLGRDVAVYGYATTAAFIPAGIRVLDLTP
jgi:HK97 family phage prohead protease